MLEKTLEQINSKQTIIEIFGMGYVGFPLSVRLASHGFFVRGIDVNSNRINKLKNNQLHESEIELEKTFVDCKNNQKFELSTIPKQAKTSKIGIICVPTPIPNKHVQSDVFVNSAIDEFLKTSKKGDIIIIESSIEVGTTDNIKKILENNGFDVGVDFGLSFCPERIDPQNKKWNLENIPRIIYCSDNTTFEISKKIYRHVNNSNLIRVSSPKIAETVKSFENTFRLVNISLVNELAMLCDNIGIDVSEVIDAAATKPFGFMPFYPGAGAGGHCIPKDPRFLLEYSKKLGLEFNTIENALQINSFMPKYVGNTIAQILTDKKLPKKIIICGLAYKPDIEDMRDSPGFKILDHLINNGFDCSVYDPFFKSDLREKYLIENHMSETPFEILPSLDTCAIKDYSCICITQHHSKTKFRLQEIYNNSIVPVVYDCQNKLIFNNISSSFLKSLGN